MEFWKQAERSISRRARFLTSHTSDRGVQAPMKLLTASLLGGSIASIFFFDWPIAAFFHERYYTWLVHLIDLWQIWGESQWYIGGGLLAYVLFWRNRPNAAWNGLYLCAAVASTGVAVNGLKLLFARARPDFPLYEGIHGFCNYSHMFLVKSFSFPSGHTVTAFTAATALGYMLPRLRVLWYMCAFLVAFSRVMTTVHFLSDVLAGAWLGIAGAVFISRLMYKEPLR